MLRCGQRVVDIVVNGGVAVFCGKLKVTEEGLFGVQEVLSNANLEDEAANPKLQIPRL